MPLPKWAKITKAPHETSSITTVKSEGLLRLECARTWQARVSEAQRHAWNEVVKVLVLHGHKHKQERRGPRATNSNSNNDFERSTYAMEPSMNYPEELLPCLVVTPPSCRIDQQALCRALLLVVWDKDEHEHRRVCRIALPRLLPTLQATFHLVLRQCLQQEPSQALSQATRKMRKKKRGTSLQQSLLWWASQTQAFDSLELILEDTGGFAQAKVREEFYQALLEWRGRHGVPISLTVLGVGGGPELGGGGMRLRHASIDPDRWMSEFWKHLLLRTSADGETPPPPPVSADCLRQLVQNYIQNDLSLSQFAESLSQRVTRYYQGNKGSFVWDSMHSHPEFLAWFATYGNAKNLLSNASGVEKLQSFQICQHLQSQLAYWWSWQRRLIPLVVCCSSESSRDCQDGEQQRPTISLDRDKVLPVLAELHALSLEQDAAITCSSSSSANQQQDKVHELLQRYLDRAEKVDDKLLLSGPCPTRDKTSNDTQTLLQELIVLVGNAKTNDDDERIQQGTLQMLDELHEIVGKQIDDLLQQWKDHNPMFPEEEGDDAQHNVVMEEESPILRQDMVQGLPSPAKQLYALLEGRLSVSRDEWLYAFGGSPEEFTLGTWYLMVCGLLQTKHKRGGGVLYEKVSVVWC